MSIKYVIKTEAHGNTFMTRKHVIKIKSSFMTRKLNFLEKISDMIIYHPFVRTKMVSDPCNISMTRLIMKFIWFYVVPTTIFLMPIVKFVSFLTLGHPE